MYSFPKNLDDRKAWVRAIPNENLSVEKVTDNMGVCALHFKDCTRWRKASRFPAPDEPPTHFPDVPKSRVGTKQPPKRTTQRATAAARAPSPDRVDSPPSGTVEVTP